MIKTYQNERLGFALNIPTNWLFPHEVEIKLPHGQDYSLTFDCGQGEAFNLYVGLLISPAQPKETEQEFMEYARAQGYTAIKFGRIIVQSRTHLWAHYQMSEKMGRQWNKKYMLVFGKTEYTITASVADLATFMRRETAWDDIVSSFCFTTSMAVSRAPQTPVVA